ncbi:hypothetical protein B0A49_06156 [Cryomyces minteri]|uniref:Sedoheptulose 1,7-bisphosphatase n=1 Tax=Cryomyces minteri TaxID=331657 RepID=A0A4V5NEC9_9PEZI|nr:hypothetical protein B0A49_06156 [Cryomyces minteri]
MPDKDAGTPRVFLVRHGETEWSQNGRYTGKTDLPLTSKGVQQVLSTSKIVIGPQKLIDPASLAHVYISPRTRAQRTFDLLLGDAGKKELVDAGKVSTTEELAEWDYGAYEGLLTHQIRERRKEKGLDGKRAWDIWTDGCEDGESADEVSARLDTLIAKIHALQTPNMHGEAPSDVLLVAHGHLLRAFAKRWLTYPLSFPLSMMIEPGGVGILSYQHRNVEEPALLLGVGFPLEE